MTYDKIRHYLGQELTQFIGSLNAEQLQKMRKELIEDINLHTLGSEILFKRTIEVTFINQLLK